MKSSLTILLSSLSKCAREGQTPKQDAQEERGDFAAVLREAARGREEPAMLEASLVFDTSVRQFLYAPDAMMHELSVKH